MPGDALSQGAPATPAQNLDCYQELELKAMTTKDLFPPQGTKAEIEEGAVFQPKFDVDGLIPAIVLDAQNRDVVMLAWMNAEALKITLETVEGHFWSRSRAKLWKKGGESGNVLQVIRVRTDCDQDAILLEVKIHGAGVACHTGRYTCFYRDLSYNKAHDAFDLKFTGQTNISDS